MDTSNKPSIFRADDAQLNGGNIMITAPYHPIVYVRGYAMTMNEVEDTVADPYMGFNKGSTKVRQLWDRSVKRYIFESPLLRLMKDHGYEDIYRSGSEIPPNETPPDRSIWIFRYYEKNSKDFGDGKKHPIEEYANDLHTFIEDIKNRYCGDDATLGKSFKVHLVAHSMGGLVARCYLQNIAPSKGYTPSTIPVEKVFTFATPHNGIDLFGGLFNAPDIGWLNVKNFDRKYMAQYLKLDSHDRVDTLNSKFPEDKFFCLVGTNHKDYNIARYVIGDMSDGLVLIENATVQGCPRAYVYRSHSGHYGIVNSESGYQNLRRFLFGDVKVEVQLDVKSVSLPKEVQKYKKKGKKIRASYHIETVSSVRGAYWQLHRRTCRENSARFVDYDRMVKQSAPLTLQTSYLLNSARVPKKTKGLAFSFELAILVPDYEVDGFAFLDRHFEGSAIFKDTFFMEVDMTGKDTPALRWGRQSESPGDLPHKSKAAPRGDSVVEYRIPVETKAAPGIAADLVLVASPWNESE